jgi:molybdopterin converting factor small subunit
MTQDFMDLPGWAQLGLVAGVSNTMITFQISGYLTEFTGGRAEITLDASPSNVGEALDRLWNEHVGLRDRVLNEMGAVRPHVNVFVNSQTVPRDRVLQTEIMGDAEVCIMPAVSGG